MQDETYAQQVNRRLTAARLLLALEEKSGINSTPVGRKAVLESALLQFYFAFCSYLNELLFYYRKPSVKASHFNLHTFLSENEKTFLGLNEFTSLKHWAKANGDIFRQLCGLPTSLLELQVAKVEKAGNAQVNPISINSNTDLIAISGGRDKIVVSELNNTFNFDSLSDVKKLVEDFQLFIDSQRESQAEY